MEAQMMDLLFNTISNNLIEMEKASSLQEKLEYSKIVKNLSESISYLTDALSTFADYEDYID
jgi:hypothetical protein